MATLTSQQEALESVPQDIRSWLSSDGAVHFLQELARKLGLHRERARVIPFALFRLIIKDIHPAEFVSVLSEGLLIGPESARTIAAEIREHILVPIKPALDEWDVDLDLIDAGDATSRATHSSTSEAEGDIESVKEELEQEAAEAGEEEVRETEKRVTAAEGKPFILHREEDIRESETEPSRKRFSLSSLGGGFFGNVQKETEAAPGARVEVPGERVKSEQKVVHYRERSGADDGGGDQGFIDLSTIESRRSGTPKPKVDGNTIDLRTHDV